MFCWRRAIGDIFLSVQLGVLDSSSPWGLAATSALQVAFKLEEASHWPAPNIWWTCHALPLTVCSASLISVRDGILNVRQLATCCTLCFISYVMNDLSKVLSRPRCPLTDTPVNTLHHQNINKKLYKIRCRLFVRTHLPVKGVLCDVSHIEVNWGASCCGLGVGHRLTGELPCQITWFQYDWRLQNDV